MRRGGTRMGDVAGQQCTMIRICAPHFTAGLELLNGRASRCAPILHYMHGWSVGQVLAYCYKKSWACEGYA